MQHRRTSVVAVATASLAAAALAAAGMASAVPSQGSSGTAGRTIIPSTAPGALVRNAKPLPATARVGVSVFVGRNLAGLNATALAVSNPHSSSYGAYLTPAQVSARFGATATQRSAVGAWLRQSGLSVTHSSPFVVSATGSAADAQRALQASLEAAPAARGSAPQVVAAHAVSVLHGALWAAWSPPSTCAAPPRRWATTSRWPPRTASYPARPRPSG